ICARCTTSWEYPTAWNWPCIACIIGCLRARRPTAPAEANRKRAPPCRRSRGASPADSFSLLRDCCNRRGLKIHNNRDNDVSSADRGKTSHEGHQNFTKAGSDRHSCIQPCEHADVKPAVG